MKLLGYALIILCALATSACGSNEQAQVQSIMWKCVTRIPELERLSRLEGPQALSRAAAARAGEIGDSCEYAQLVLEHREWSACEDTANQYAILAERIGTRTDKVRLSAYDAGRAFEDAEAALRRCTHDLDQR